MDNKLLTTEYYKNFWVGLMDGDGSIQVNHWRKKYLQFRLIIKLKYTVENYNMLILMKENIGGSVNVVSDDNFVIWVENVKERIVKDYLPIFSQYPPLTSRLQCQLAFLTMCANLNDISLYFQLREKKYENYAQYEKIIVQNVNKNRKDYFCTWLSGFIEAEGCFSTRLAKRNRTFSIGQNTDLFLLELIKDYLKASNNKIRHINKTGKDFYLLEVGSVATLQKVYNHCHTYPLLGFKQTQFLKFYSDFIF